MLTFVSVNEGVNNPIIYQFMKAVIYARVSSISDRQNTERQIEDLKAYASANCYKVEKVFSEKLVVQKRMQSVKCFWLVWIMLNRMELI